MTNKNDNRKRQNKMTQEKERMEFAQEFDIQNDPTPERNEKYGSESHKN
ncbi:hypothetical protein [Bacillus solimangrovi]|nr:hypothetical protein [Bacillus solimangrovi]